MDGNLAVNHLLLRLRPVHRGLRRAVARQRQTAARLDRADLSPSCISDDHVDVLLGEVDEWLAEDSGGTDPASAVLSLTADEATLEAQYRRRAEE